MAAVPDDQEKLLIEVRRTIDENKRFIEQLLDEGSDLGEAADEVTPQEEFEEL